MKMINSMLQWFNRECPPNLIIRKPMIGALIIGGFVFVFAMLYRPLGAHPGKFFGYGMTMAMYSVVLAGSALGAITMIKRVNFFSSEEEWTIFKEIVTIIMILAAMGLTVFMAAFIFEPPADRWNLPTLSDSMTRTFLIGIIPFLFFTAFNFRYWIIGDQMVYAASNSTPESVPAISEHLIRIGSQLKKEELSFYDSQFIYAESDSNYVVFYLYQDSKLQKEIIRNSITNIEQQLADFPWMFRTHRAFIVNLKCIEMVKGNALGYRLKLDKVDTEIPVSRSNASDFIKRLKQFKK